MRRSVLLILVTAILQGSGPLLAQAPSQSVALRPTPLGPMITQLHSLDELQPDTTLLQAATPVREFIRPVLQSRSGRHEGTVLMIVGGAGILAGLLLEESIITIAGAGVAGVGLYFYLR